jgi:hypothetical protein
VGQVRRSSDLGDAHVSEPARPNLSGSRLQDRIAISQCFGLRNLHRPGRRRLTIIIIDVINVFMITVIIKSVARESNGGDIFPAFPLIGEVNHEG